MIRPLCGLNKVEGTFAVAYKVVLVCIGFGFVLVNEKVEVKLIGLIGGLERNELVLFLLV